MLLHAKLFYPLHMFDVTFHTVAFVHVHARSYFFLGSYYLRNVLTFSCFLFVKYSYVHLLGFFLHVLSFIFFLSMQRPVYLVFFVCRVQCNRVVLTSNAIFFLCHKIRTYSEVLMLESHLPSLYSIF